MIQRTVNHPAGRFARCRICGCEPHHISAAGTTTAEPVAFATIGQRHHLECRCGARTARHNTITGAETEWGSDYAQLALPLSVRKHRRVAA
ncbi:MAG: hypothetical protein ABIU96_04060 [Rhodanobacter sp.]